MQYSKEEKAMWLEEWRKSGKGAWTYAKANSLNPQTFKKWIKAETKGNVRIRIPLSSGSSGRAVMEGLRVSLW